MRCPLLDAGLDRDAGELLVADLTLEVAIINMSDFVRENAGQLRLILHIAQRATSDEDVSARHGEGIGDIGIENREMIGHVTALAELRDRAADHLNVLVHVGIVVDTEDVNEFRRGAIADHLLFFGRPRARSFGHLGTFVHHRARPSAELRLRGSGEEESEDCGRQNIFHRYSPEPVPLARFQLAIVDESLGFFGIRLDAAHKLGDAFVVASRRFIQLGSIDLSVRANTFEAERSGVSRLLGRFGRKRAAEAGVIGLGLVLLFIFVLVLIGGFIFIFLGLLFFVFVGAVLWRSEDSARQRGS